MNTSLTSPAEAVGGFYRALMARDPDGLRASLADDAVLHVPGTHPLGHAPGRRRRAGRRRLLELIMNVIDLTHDIHIAQPAAHVWSVIADYSRDPEWRVGVSAMVPSPLGSVQLGTTTAETLRLGGKTWHNDGEVTEVVPGRRFSWRTTTGADAHGSRSVEPVGERDCRVRLELHVRPRGFERLLAPMLRRMLDRNLRGDLERLATIIGSDLGAAPSLLDRAQVP